MMISGRLKRDAAALVLVDYQARLMPAIEAGARCIDAAAFLAKVARRLEVPVIGTEQNPSKLGPNADVLRTRCDATVSKMHFDACPDGLLAVLRGWQGRAIEQVVLGGCEAHVCLQQTALGLMQAGFGVAVVPEACGSRRAADKALGIERLRQQGASILSAEMVAFEWLGTCEDPAFRDVQAIIKAQPV